MCGLIENGLGYIVHIWLSLTRMWCIMHQTDSHTIVNGLLKCILALSRTSPEIFTFTPLFYAMCFGGDSLVDPLWYWFPLYCLIPNIILTFLNVEPIHCYFRLFINVSLSILPVRQRNWFIIASGYNISMIPFWHNLIKACRFRVTMHLR